MGLSPFKRCSTNYMASAPNPSPNKWALINIAEFMNGYVLKVKYDDRTNFEGIKIMVYRGKFVPSLQLDLHFADNNTAPIARFKPNNEGWNMAIILAKSLKS